MNVVGEREGGCCERYSDAECHQKQWHPFFRGGVGPGADDFSGGAGSSPVFFTRSNYKEKYGGPGECAVTRRILAEPPCKQTPVQTFYHFPAGRHTSRLGILPNHIENASALSETCKQPQSRVIFQNVVSLLKMLTIHSHHTSSRQ